MKSALAFSRCAIPFIACFVSTGFAAEPEPYDPNGVTGVVWRLSPGHEIGLRFSDGETEATVKYDSDLVSAEWLTEVDDDNSKSINTLHIRVPKIEELAKNIFRDEGTVDSADGIRDAIKHVESLLKKGKQSEITVRLRNQVVTGDREVSFKVRVELMDYEQASRLALTESLASGGFQDSYGFLVSRGLSGEAEDVGDSVIFSGLAAVYLAWSGDEQATMKVLETLERHAWSGRNPIRHPESREATKYNRDNWEVNKRPMPKDGLVGVTAMLSAVNRSSLSDDTKVEARSLLIKYATYLEQNDWRTIKHYPEWYWERKKVEGKERHLHVWDENEKERNRKSYLGPESFAMSPLEHLAFKRVAIAYGVLGAAAWNSPAAIHASARATAADYIAHVGSRDIGTRLTKLGVSKADQKNIDNFLKKLVRLMLKDKTQHQELGSLLADELAGELPIPFGEERWREKVTAVVEKSVPWLYLDAIKDLSYIIGACELMKLGGSESEEHMLFWSILTICENRPEISHLVRSYVKDNYDAFTRDSALFAWLSGDGRRVDQFLADFEQSPLYDKSDYAWIRSRSSRRNRQSTPWSRIKKYSHRLDYLILRELKRRGLPKLDQPKWSSLAAEIRPPSLQELVASAPLKELAEHLSAMDPGEAFKILKQLPLESTAKILAKMNPNSAAHVLYEFDWNSIDKLVERLGPKSSARILMELEWEELSRVFSRIDSALAANVIYEYSWKDLRAVFRHLDSATAASIIKAYDWERVVLVFRNLPGAVGADIIYEYEWPDVSTFFRNLDNDTRARIINAFDEERQRAVLNHLPDGVVREVKELLPDTVESIFDDALDSVPVPNRFKPKI